VKFQNTVEHYRILRDQSGKYFLWVVKFESLNQLINYHKQNSISRTSMILLKENSGHVHHNQGYQPQPGAPPRQRNNTQNTFEAVTAYRFVGEESNELSFEAGEQIIVHVYRDGSYQLNENWWYGQLRNQTGLFPTNYVTITDQVKHQFNIRVQTAHP